MSKRVEYHVWIRDTSGDWHCVWNQLGATPDEACAAFAAALTTLGTVDYPREEVKLLRDAQRPETAESHDPRSTAGAVRARGANER